MRPSFCRRAVKAAQPLFETRPHLISSGEITPGIPAAEYYQRRQRLLAALPDNSVAIVPGNQTQYSTNVVFFEFRQDPNFWYLTGFQEPESALVLFKKNDQDMRSIMFVPESDAKSELWEGERAGTDGAVNIFNADEAYPIGEMGSRLDLLLKNTQQVFADVDSLPQRLVTKEWIGTIKSSPISKYYALNPLVERMRIQKSENEIDCMRTACEISALAYNSAFQTTFPTESSLAAFLEYQFKLNGASGSAYVPVVAGGKHALTIHYVRNDDVLLPEDLVLVDAGAYYGGYTADISRTWPVGGKFSEPQKQLYEAVLNVNKKCIKLCHAQTGYSMSELHHHSDKIMVEELSQVLSGVTSRNVRQLYPHSIGHHVGIDVHDLSSPVRYMALQPNHVVTVEPGVYVPIGSEWPKEFHGIGIRVEDNVVVGSNPDNMEILTADTVKEVSDLERLS